ncbi:efflux RND transporter periplasmic adaptor subunit [Rhodohalobacter sp. SW132]|uniref:efflux RND transporter periplasmic adaptor subunit n=1 Tax=Rhodohalobacter sp. SW132 TaxID=2293433 RepID=UPI000E21DA75|nr:efflux RND transporter periplasmic adaptor subunit [Rhodohalobacter sp. SW132]REL37767.1 efflux RND transporter periplasmic adaptor subunit [Rhodohalobacter sp. SW132]
MKLYRFYGVLLLITGLLLAGCGSDSSNGGGPPDFSQMGGGGQATSVEVIPVETSSISDQIRSFGTIRAQDVVNINPQVSNRVLRIHADLGDTVSQGDLLAKIYDVPFRDAYEQAQAQYRQSRIAFERDSTQFSRQERLFETGAISSSEFEEARATLSTSRSQLEAAEASLTNSREDLANTEVRSPVNGVVLSRSIAEGDIASTGETAFEIANLIGYETRLHLPMQDWEDISVGLPVELRMSNRQQTIAEGVISRISPQLNPETGLGEVVVSLIDASSSVRQGVLAESRITLETRENTIIIPRSAMIENVETYIEPETNTVELRRNYSVFVAQGDTVATRKELILGLEQGERVEVLSGLEEGESLIITGQSALREGGRVRIAGQQQSGPDRSGEIEMMEQAEGGERGQGQRQTNSDSNSN